jgi:hypothetical protein
MGAKLLDGSIDTKTILENVLIPEEIAALPDTHILCVDWPPELLHRDEDQVVLDSPHGQIPLWGYSIELTANRPKQNEIRFRVIHETHSAEFALKLGATDFRIARLSGEKFTIQFGRVLQPLEDWLTENPPSILYVDGSELDGNLLVRASQKSVQAFAPTQITSWDWTGINIKTESIWKNGVNRANSVQRKTVDMQLLEGFDIVFNDDAAGEAADVIGIKRHPNHIQVRLIHCKYTTKDEAGERVKDVVEVCSQAVRSSRWGWRFADLCTHMLAREKNVPIAGASTRFEIGDAKKLNQYVRLSRTTPLKLDIVIVQPGLSQANVTADQAMVLNAANAYLKETVNVGLTVIGSP